MSRVVELLCSRRVPHVAALALISFGFAGCSADMSTRLSQNPFSNPFASQPEATGSVPAPAVERRELAAICPPAIAIPVASPAAAGLGAAVLSDGERRRVRRRARACLLCAAGAAARDHRQRRAALGRGDPRPTQAGTTIIVGTSDTLDILARRYNVTPAAILQANGYKGPRALSPGQQLIIPHPAAAAAAAPALAAPASKPVCGRAAAPSVHFVNRGDTLLSIAHHNHVSVAELARANNLDPQAKLKLGTKLTVPGAKTAAVAPAAHLWPLPPPSRRGSAPPATKMAAATAARPANARGSPRPRPRSRTLPPRRRSRPAKRPARCRPSAGRCAAR